MGLVAKLAPYLFVWDYSKKTEQVKELKDVKKAKKARAKLNDPKFVERLRRKYRR